MVMLGKYLDERSDRKMEDKYIEAKKIFLKYNYSGNIMLRESFNNDFKTYMNYKVPKELQLEWAHEYQVTLIEKIYKSKNNREIFLNFLSFHRNICDNIDFNNTTNIYTLLKKIENNLDSYTKERIAAIILEYLGLIYTGSIIEYNGDVIKVEILAICWLKEVIQGPVTIDQSYFNETDKKRPYYVSKSNYEPNKIVQSAKKALVDWHKLNEKYIHKNESQIVHEKKEEYNK